MIVEDYIREYLHLASLTLDEKKLRSSNSDFYIHTNNSAMKKINNMRNKLIEQECSEVSLLYEKLLFEIDEKVRILAAADCLILNVNVNVAIDVLEKISVSTKDSYLRVKSKNCYNFITKYNRYKDIGDGSPETETET